MSGAIPVPQKYNVSWCIKYLGLIRAIVVAGRRSPQDLGERTNESFVPRDERARQLPVGIRFPCSVCKTRTLYYRR